MIKNRIAIWVINHRFFLIILLFLFIIYINFGTMISATNNLSQISEKSSFKAGQLRVVEGVKFLKLTGSYYEMGEQYGVLMKEDIKGLIAFRKVGDSIQKYSETDAASIKRFIPNRYLDFMKGLSDGSGISFPEIFWLTFTTGEKGCSSILVKTKRHLLHGHNQDRSSPSRFKIMVEFNPENYYKYIISTFVGTCEALEGMNEKGITLTQDQALHKFETRKINPNKPYVLQVFKFMEILDSAASLKEVDKSILNILDTSNIVIVRTG